MKLSAKILREIADHLVPLLPADHKLVCTPKRVYFTAPEVYSGVSHQQQQGVDIGWYTNRLMVSYQEDDGSISDRRHFIDIANENFLDTVVEHVFRGLRIKATLLLRIIQDGKSRWESHQMAEYEALLAKYRARMQLQPANAKH
jgi:hypothetical protein